MNGGLEKRLMDIPVKAGNKYYGFLTHLRLYWRHRAAVMTRLPQRQLRPYGWMTREISCFAEGEHFIFNGERVPQPPSYDQWHSNVNHDAQWTTSVTKSNITLLNVFITPRQWLALMQERSVRHLASGAIAKPANRFKAKRKRRASR